MSSVPGPRGQAGQRPACPALADQAVLPPESPERCLHLPASSIELAQMITALYRAGYGYHMISDLSRLGLTHQDMHDILTNPNYAVNIIMEKQREKR